VDSRGTSEASQTFSLNTTLRGLRLAPAGTGAFPLELDFGLLHPAALTLQVETRSGAVLKVIQSAQEPAGNFSSTWNGRFGHKSLPRGRYQIRAIAVNSIGTMDLVAPFRLG